MADECSALCLAQGNGEPARSLGERCLSRGQRALALVEGSGTGCRLCLSRRDVGLADVKTARDFRLRPCLRKLIAGLAQRLYRLGGGFWVADDGEQRAGARQVVADDVKAHVHSLLM